MQNISDLFNFQKIDLLKILYEGQGHLDSVTLPRRRDVEFVSGLQRVSIQHSSFLCLVVQTAKTMFQYVTTVIFIGALIGLPIARSQSSQGQQLLVMDLALIIIHCYSYQVTGLGTNAENRYELGHFSDSSISSHIREIKNIKLIPK